MADVVDADPDEPRHRWETGYEKTWEAIEEDNQGLLDQSLIAEIIEKSKRKRLIERRNAGTIRLGIIRHLFIILDLSEAMLDQDLKPNRILSTIKILEKFIDGFFDCNPMSQIGWIGTRNKKAEKMAEMTGNLRKHMEFVQTLYTKFPCSGEPSLQNSLEMAMATLKHLPSHTSKEVLIISGNLTTCDPGSIDITIQNLQKYNIRCSVIALAAEVRVYKLLCKETRGVFNVILDDTHFQDLMQEHFEPPPAASSQRSSSSLIKMGFPQRSSQGTATDTPGMCLCHLDDPSICKFTSGGYTCPQCHNKYCELPTECKACGLTLVSAPHLARSFLHIFPLDPFEEINPLQGNCFGCLKPLPDGNKHIYRCKKCNRKFCLDCDLFLHEVLHTCPGCAAIPPVISKS